MSAEERTSKSASGPPSPAVPSFHRTDELVEDASLDGKRLDGEQLDPESDDLADVPVAEGTAAEGTSRTRGKKERGGSLEAMVLVLFAFLLALFLKQYVAEAYEIKGRSMEPTFADGQRVVVQKAFYSLERGDIVVFSSTEDPSKDLIKRVVGVPEDVLSVKAGKLHVNGRPCQEDYLFNGQSGLYRRNLVTLAEGKYYVLGDNRPDSHDSRFFGAIPAGNIKGKVVLRWWPFTDFRSF